jgi:hypothetical protein
MELLAGRGSAIQARVVARRGKLRRTVFLSELGYVAFSAIGVFIDANAERRSICGRSRPGMDQRNRQHCQNNGQSGERAEKQLIYKAQATRK